eukprot:jgi/Chlat1/156/Chrsp1S03101
MARGVFRPDINSLRTESMLRVQLKRSTYTNQLVQQTLEAERQAKEEALAAEGLLAPEPLQFEKAPEASLEERLSQLLQFITSLVDGVPSPSALSLHQHPYPTRSPSPSTFTPAPSRKRSVFTASSSMKQQQPTPSGMGGLALPRRLMEARRVEAAAAAQLAVSKYRRQVEERRAGYLRGQTVDLTPRAAEEELDWFQQHYQQQHDEPLQQQQHQEHQDQKDDQGGVGSEERQKRESASDGDRVSRVSSVMKRSGMDEWGQAQRLTRGNTAASVTFAPEERLVHRATVAAIETVMQRVEKAVCEFKRIAAPHMSPKLPPPPPRKQPAEPTRTATNITTPTNTSLDNTTTAPTFQPQQQQNAPEPPTITQHPSTPSLESGEDSRASAVPLSDEEARTVIKKEEKPVLQLAPTSSVARFLAFLQQQSSSSAFASSGEEASSNHAADGEQQRQQHNKKKNNKNNKINSQAGKFQKVGKFEAAAAEKRREERSKEKKASGGGGGGGGSVAASVQTVRLPALPPSATEAEALQRRLERVWAVFRTPVMERMDMVLKYTAKDRADALETALEAWERAAEAFLQREHVLELRREHLMRVQRREEERAQAHAQAQAQAHAQAHAQAQAKSFSHSPSSKLTNIFTSATSEDDSEDDHNTPRKRGEDRDKEERVEEAREQLEIEAEMEEVSRRAGEAVGMLEAQFEDVVCFNGVPYKDTVAAGRSAMEPPPPPTPTAQVQREQYQRAHRRGQRGQRGQRWDEDFHEVHPVPGSASTSSLGSSYNPHQEQEDQQPEDYLATSTATYHSHNNRKDIPEHEDDDPLSPLSLLASSPVSLRAHWPPLPPPPPRARRRKKRERKKLGKREERGRRDGLIGEEEGGEGEEVVLPAGFVLLSRSRQEGDQGGGSVKTKSR